MSEHPVVMMEKVHVEASLRNLRTVFPGEPDVEILAKVLQSGVEECSPESVLVYARKVKRFSTSSVMNRFSVGKYKVAGALAALRGRGAIEPDEPEVDEYGYSRWKVC